MKSFYPVILLFGLSLLQLQPSYAVAQNLILRDAIHQNDITNTIKPPPPTSALEQIYQRHNYQYLWFSNNRLTNSAKIFLQRLKAADQEGLFRYKRATEILTARLPKLQEEKNRILCELLLTSALTCYIRDVTGYISNPMADNSDKAFQAEQLIQLVSHVFDAMNKGEDLALLIKNLTPAHHYYNNLKDGLQKYLRIRANGGWPTIQAGKKISPGESDPRIIAIRKRLAIELDGFQNLATNRELYDAKCQAGIRQLQRKYGLEADGIIGRETQGVLQRTTTDVIQTIGVNLTRWRWQSHSLGKRYILVNISGFYIQAIEDGNQILELPVVVGANNHQTPVFSSIIKRVDLNPYWKIPPGIAEKELLPILQTNPRYLKEKNIRLFANWEPDAVELDSEPMDWSKVSKNTMRSFLLRQDPGKENALGAVKIVFPNQYDVYLHDTPQKHLFVKNRKNFSHGCIRVQDPVKLAAYLLKPQAQ